MKKELVAEASTMGWRPGYRPNTVVTDGVTFDLMHTEIHDGDVKFWLYVEVFLSVDRRLVYGETTITVFND